MRRTFYSNIVILPIVLSATGAVAAKAGNQEMLPTAATTRACAEHDLRVITGIEEHGNIGDMAGQKLAEATFAMVRARIECADGREREALVIYDEILIGLARMQASGR